MWDSADQKDVELHLAGCFFKKQVLYYGYMANLSVTYFHLQREAIGYLNQEFPISLLHNCVSYLVACVVSLKVSGF